MTNKCLNFFKGIACIMVVFIHFPFPGIFGKFVTVLAGFGVPLFFLISGYYTYNADNTLVQEKLQRKIKHIFKLCIVATIIFFVYTAMRTYIDNGFTGVLDWLKGFASPQYLMQILFLQKPGCLFLRGGVLWFLYALFWGYVILYFINRTNRYKTAYLLIPILFFIRMIVSGITMVYFEDIHNICIVNVYMTGFPYIMLGNLIARYRKQILEKLTVKKLFLGIVVGIALSCLSEQKMLMIDIGYIGVILYSISIFLLAQKYPEREPNKLFAIIGEKYFTFVYIMHMIIEDFINKIFLIFHVDEILQGGGGWIRPIVVAATCVICAVIWEKVVNLFGKFKEAVYKSIQI